MEIFNSLNMLDIILIIITVIFVVKGLIKGFLYEAASVLGILLSFWIAYMGYTALGSFLRRYIPSQQWADILAYIGLFCIVMIIFALTTSALSRHIKFKGGGFMDCVGGGLLGIVKGGILCIFIVVILGYALPVENLVKRSQLAKFINSSIEYYQNQHNIVQNNDA